MFPLNLQRNIIQLDRQISLLENECKNMEVENKKKSLKLEATYSSHSKSANARVKPPSIRLSTKKGDSLKRSKRQTPPCSSRLQFTGSLPSHRSRNDCENGDTLMGRKTKSYGLNPKASVYSCQMLGSPQCNSRGENKCANCFCSNEVFESDLCKNDTFDVTKKDHVLLFPNSGGTIEVRVTQKPNKGNENSQINCKSQGRKSVNLEKDIEKDLDGCKCQFKGQKWSEILSVDSSKKGQSQSENFVRNKIQTGETKIIYQPASFNSIRKSEESSLCENASNFESAIQGETFEAPVKLSSQLSRTKNQSDINSNKFEKEIQCSLENINLEETAKELKDPVKIFQFLLNQIEHISGAEVKISPALDTFIKSEGTLKEQLDVNKNNSVSSPTLPNNASYMNAVKHHCENLIKEKSLLTEELAAKENMIATMKKREEEYLSLIASLKSSLEKVKERAQEGGEAAKQMDTIKSKLVEQLKVSEALKNRVIKLQDDSREIYLENSKLRTEVKILMMEGQKYAIILAGKDAEISRYKEEIKNFQRQIEEHLTSLKSNAQLVDIEKMVEAIMQQSQIFAQTELYSVLEKDEKDSSKTQNVLMHSSPTSTKTSVVNSSWKQISSIHEQDQSKANSEVIYLNDENNQKNFFDIFGEKSQAGTPKKTKEPSLEKLMEKSSFSSCVSLRENQETSKSSSRDSLISKDTLLSVEEAGEEETKDGSGLSLDKAQNNIDELLKKMKLKFSKEIFETTLPSCTTEDCLDISQISSISQM